MGHLNPQHDIFKESKKKKATFCVSMNLEAIEKAVSFSLTLVHTTAEAGHVTGCEDSSENKRSYHKMLCLLSEVLVQRQFDVLREYHRGDSYNMKTMQDSAHNVSNTLSCCNTRQHSPFFESEQLKEDRCSCEMYSHTALCLGPMSVPFITSVILKQCWPAILNLA